MSLYISPVCSVSLARSPDRFSSLFCFLSPYSLLLFNWVYNFVINFFLSVSSVWLLIKIDGLFFARFYSFFEIRNGGIVLMALFCFLFFVSLPFHFSIHYVRYCCCISLMETSFDLDFTWIFHWISVVMCQFQSHFYFASSHRNYRHSEYSRSIGCARAYHIRFDAIVSFSVYIPFTGSRLSATNSLQNEWYHTFS